MTAVIYWHFVEADARLPWWTGAGEPDFLSAREVNLLAGLRFPKRRREWLLGRWTAKQLLLGCLPGSARLNNGSITIANEESGAPFACLPGGAALPGTLSISHRGSCALCACSHTLPVGADLELIEAHSTAFIQDYFTPGEARRALRLSTGERDLYASLLWSAKEAALKALRVGLRLDTRSIEIDPGETLRPSTGWQPLRYQSYLPKTHGLRGWWQANENRVMTLAVLAPREEDVRIKQIS